MATELGAGIVRYNCYLLAEGVASGDALFRPDFRSDGKYPLVEIDAAGGVPEGIRAFLGVPRVGQPDWALKLAPMFPDLTAVETVSHRLVVLLPVGDRVFALTFGYASSVLRRSVVVPNFGLQYAARVFKPDGLREIQSRRMDASARTQRVQIHRDGGVRELDVSTQGEFVFKLVGRADAQSGTWDLGGDTIVASDSVSFRAEANLTALSARLADMLTVVQQGSVKDAFDFVDALTPIAATDDRVPELDRKLVAALNRERAGRNVSQTRPSDSELVTIAPPEGMTDVEQGQVFCAGESGDRPLSLVTASAFLSGVAPSRRFTVSSLSSSRIEVRSEDKAEVLESTRLRDWIVFESSFDGDRLIHTRGRWWLLDGNYVSALDRDLASIPDATQALGLRMWPSGTRESVFLESCANESNLVLDQVDLRSGGYEVESCDLLTLGGDLLHVKKFTGSQTLSHLFAQGYVSADLLRGDAEYREQFIEAVRKRSLAHVPVAEAAPVRVVYVIGAARSMRVPEDLPTFSKVNLREYARRLSTMQVQVALAKVTMTVG